LQTRVTGIQQPVGRRGYLLQLDSGEQPSFDAVVLAVPAYRAAELLAPLNPDLAGQLNRIEYASTALVITGHRLSDVAHPLDAFGLVIPQVEQRQILAVSFASRKFPGRAPDGCVLLRTFVGGALQPELFRLSDDRLLALVREELQALLGVRGEPTMSLVVRWKQSMPQYHVGHLDLVAGIERELQTAPRLALAGNAYRGVGIPDCIASGQAAADRILAGLPQYFRLSPKK
jgi:oxygen-dependent protoporphyrinogen oxidase